MNGIIAFIIVTFVLALIIAVCFAISQRRAARREREEWYANRRAAADQKIWDDRVAREVERRKNMRPHPNDPSYRHTVPLSNTGRTSYNGSASMSPTYDPMTDMLSPLNPLSPLNQVYHSDPDPSPSHSHDPSPSYSTPEPSPSHDSGSSYGGDSYGGSSYDSGGGGYDGGSSGGGGDF